jgi:CDP-glycerol glycerophosphotransferase
MQCKPIARHVRQQATDPVRSRCTKSPATTEFGPALPGFGANFAEGTARSPLPHQGRGRHRIDRIGALAAHASESARVAVRIVYQSYGRYSDSPRAVFERIADRPDTEHIWLSERDHLAGFPSVVATVALASPKAVEVLESADLVVANTHTDVEWSKKPGAIYLQTWHGTPLKRIHHDVLWSPPGLLRRFDQDVARWDVLLSPNAASTPRLRQAFRFEKKILESGYPRNDILNDPDREALRASVRRELGLADDVTAVLYAPTWRDDEYFGDGTSPAAAAVDVPLLAERLPADHHVLVRSHVLMTGRSPVDETDRVVDVSYYPHVQDLYLAADVLVTDYSSVMFDFAVTGKPIVFHAYDLERYATTVRGFYFDLASTAPGPITRTDAELAEVLPEVGRMKPVYAARYREFQKTYCHLEDGHATDRVLSELGL